MARFGFLGGGGRSSGGRPRSTGGRSSGASRSSRKGRSSRKPAQGSLVAYSIYNSRGRRTYVGTTNNPERRAAQHAKSGKLTRDGELVVESRPMSRSAAQQLEAKKLQGYRSRTGRLPRHDKTSDGQYRFWD